MVRPPLAEFASADDRTGNVPADAPMLAPVAPAAIDGDRLVRNFLFLATFLLTWFTTEPFQSLSDPSLLEPQTSGDTLNQAAMILLTAALAGYVLLTRSWLFLRAVTLPLVLIFAAFAISALLSAYPGLAGRRVVLAGFTTFQATVILLLPTGREHFARLLALSCFIIIGACYVGVALFPQLSIHQVTDLSEPNLAGDWRGFFTHKNGAGAGMVLLIFAGIFICRTWDKVVGIALIALAAVFLYFTHSKSPFNLLLVVLPLSYLIPRTRSVVLMFMLVAGVAFLINVATLGSVMFPQIKELLTHVMSDPTFTGRDVIWEFGLDHVAQRPWFGFGFEAFWRMPDLVDDWNFMESWGYQASDAHNGYLNLAITTGLVGLGLTLWWMVAQPFADLRRVLSRDGDRALTTLFVQIWLFSLCLGGFESVFFSGGKTPWFLMVSSIMGLRLQTWAKTAD